MSHAEGHGRDDKALQGRVRRALMDARDAREAVRSAVEIVHASSPRYDWTGIYLLEDPATLVLSHYIGEPTPHTRIPLDKGVCGAAARAGETIIVPDVNADPRYLSCSLRTRSEIVVPIVNRVVTNSRGSRCVRRGVGCKAPRRPRYFLSQRSGNDADGTAPPQPFGQQGVAAPHVVARRRRPPGSASSSLLVRVSQAPAARPTGVCHHPVKDGAVYGEIDIDSWAPDAFGPADREQLEQVAALIADKLAGGGAWH